MALAAMKAVPTVLGRPRLDTMLLSSTGEDEDGEEEHSEHFLHSSVSGHPFFLVHTHFVHAS
jgi:hypothetical protein